VCQVFGDHARAEDEEAERRGERRPDLRASAVWCFDALPEQVSPVHTLVRDGVGIDRRTGTSAAEARAKYDREWIPAGTAFSLRVELERDAPDHAEALLALALTEWVEGRGRIGGGAARGGGAFTLSEPCLRRSDLGSREGLLRYLAGGVPGERGTEVEGWREPRLAWLRERRDRAPEPGHRREGAVESFAELRFELAFAGPVLVNDPAAALAHGVNSAPVFAGPDWTDPVLPGASLRGVLRAQVERIARTLALHAAKDAASFARICAACDPFEWARKRRPEGEAGPERMAALRSCAAVGEERADRGEEEPEGCLGCRLFGSTRRGSRLWVADAPLADARPTYRLRDFVAIDRFTGGALDGAKFDAIPLYGARFRAGLLLWDPEPWELGALALALRDLHDGLATVGAHGSKGFGRAAVESVALRVGRLRDGDPDLAEMRDAGDSGVFRVREWSGTPETLVADARSVGWMDRLARECATARREVPQGAEVVDGYFGSAAEGLYPPLHDLAELEVILAR
jgi:CRISPR/Cas system CSM-associated protein Csm3 (group 7 of RAMP superfamily)